MNVLITGAAGFIGSNFVHYLREKRPTWNIVALDALTYAGNLENIAALIGKARFAFERTDITDVAALRAIFNAQKFDLLFHLAAESHVDRSIMSAAEFVKTNVLGTQNLLNAAMEFKTGRFVHISTDEVYGSLGPTGRFYEHTPLNPTSPYAASKAASDVMVFACRRTHGLDAIVTRCTNNYGPYQFPEKFIPLFISNALENKKLPLYGDGMNVRSWIYVSDHCEALLLAAEKGKSGEAYNIGSLPDAEIPNKEVAQRIVAALKKPETLIEYVGDRPAHDRRYAVSIEKIEHELGWRPRTSFAGGLNSTVQWYIDNESWWRRIKTGEYLQYYQKNYGKRG